MKRTALRLLTLTISLILLTISVIACAKVGDTSETNTDNTTLYKSAAGTTEPDSSDIIDTEPSTTKGGSDMTTSIKDLFPGDDQGTRIPYNQSEYRIDFRVWQPLSSPGVVIETVAELESYFTREANRFHFDQQGGKRLMAAVDRYNEHFFENNILVFVRVMAGSGSDRFYIDHVGKTANALKIHVGADHAEIGTMDMAGHHLVIEISRKDLPNGDWQLDLSGAGTNPGPRAGRGHDLAYF